MGTGGGNGYQLNTSSSNQITVNLTGLNADGTQLARWALDAWKLVADLEFVEVSSGGLISFDDDKSGAFAGTNSNVYAQSAYVNVSTAWVNSYGVELNSYAFQTYILEIGHALGLGHQGGYNGNATYGTGEDFQNGSWQMSVMSYFSLTEITSINASLALSIIPMMVDIVAIQDLHGMSDVAAGDTGGSGYDDLTGVAGLDTLNGGSGNGSLDGGADADMLNGVARSDRLAGGYGDDNILGGTGAGDRFGGYNNDALVGGAGNDTLSGGLGADNLYSPEALAMIPFRTSL